MRERTIRPRGPRGRERVGGNISAYDESLLHAGKRPTDTPQKRARRRWQGRSRSPSSSSERDENRFGTFHLLTETHWTRRRAIAPSDLIDSTLPKIATSSRRNDCQSTEIPDTARRERDGLRRVMHRDESAMMNKLLFSRRLRI